MDGTILRLMRRLSLGRSAGLALAAAAALLGAAPAAAQVQSVDPDKAIDADLVKAPAVTAAPATPAVPAAAPTATAAGSVPDPTASPGFETPAVSPAQLPTAPGQTYRKDDLIGAAEGVFGKGAHGLANLIQDILSKQGEPNAYITGREGGGAIVVGLRYGSGTLYHKVEGEKPVYWTGPSIGFDAGANAANTFVLVYNLYDTADLFKRFGAGEGQAYLVGGFNVSYLRRGNVVLIPVRMGVGLRLGLNAGYMKFSRSQKWFPF
jgi:hypothetical protein